MINGFTLSRSLYWDELKNTINDRCKELKIDPNNIVTILSNELDYFVLYKAKRNYTSIYCIVVTFLAIVLLFV